MSENILTVGQKTTDGSEIFNDYENNNASDNFSHAEGESTEAIGNGAHSEGQNTQSNYTGSHAEGVGSKTTGHGAHAENTSTAEGHFSHSEGNLSKAIGANSHAEGQSSGVTGRNSHAEGHSATASGTAAHAEGFNTTASGDKSHAEGYYTKATGIGSHAEGSYTLAEGKDSHAEGNNTKAIGNRSHAGGLGTIANHFNQSVVGKYNANKYYNLFEVGNGSSDTNRSNAFEVRADGTLSIGGVAIEPLQFEELLKKAYGDSETDPYSIAMFPETLTMCVGKTEKLTALPRPVGSTYDKIVWSVDNEDIVTVDSSGNVTAHATGDAVVTATVICNDFEKTEYSAKCFITVENQVVIKRVDGQLQVHFLSSGKIWRCINENMLYDPNYVMSTSTRDKFRLNYYGSLYYNDNIVTYTDDEIKLLYAVDPFGVAYYIHNYAKDTVQSGKDVIEETLRTKDYYYHVLFNKEPLYFYEAANGQWYQMDKKDIDTEKENYCSESEAYFGAHQTYDKTDAIIGLIDFGISIVNIFFPGVSVVANVVGAVAKIWLLINNNNYEETINEVYEIIADFDNNSVFDAIENAFAELSVLKNFAELLMVFKTKPKYYRNIIDYCITSTIFTVYMQLKDSSLKKLTDIYEVV